MARMNLDTTVEVVGVADVLDGMEDVLDEAQGEVRYVVGTQVEYAVYLEFGTSRMPPYPFLRPAAEWVMSGPGDQIANNADSIEGVVRDIALAIEARAKHYASTGVPPGPDVQTGNLRSSIRAEKVS